MSSSQELLRQRDALELQIKEARKREKSDVVKNVRQLIVDHGLSPRDLFPSSRSRTGVTGKKVPAKYRDPVSGVTWTGRGKAPRWIANQDRARFLINR